MLTDQPPPRPGRSDVTPVAREMFLTMLAHQEAKGIATYGTTLQTHTGRDPLLDALAELVDALAIRYLCRPYMERESQATKGAEV
jgi:hypothetical protein